MPNLIDSNHQLQGLNETRKGRNCCDISLFTATEKNVDGLECTSANVISQVAQSEELENFVVNCSNLS